MVRYLIGIGILLSLSVQAHTAHRVLKLMGSRFEFVAVHDELQQAERSIDAAIEEVQRLERMISSWDPNSFTARVNAMAGKKRVGIPEEMYRLIERSIKVSDLTEGAFDITIGPLLEIYTFNGGSGFPPEKLIDMRKGLVDYRKIELREEDGHFFVLLKEPGMRIGFGAIGKGWAADRAKKLMEGFGLRGGMVSASGDLICWGSPEDGEKWRVGIADPENKERVIKWLELSNAAVVTSGDYEKYLMHANKRFSHIIDPRSGYPTSGIRSVTIITIDAEIGDALATSVFVLGLEEGLRIVEEIDALEMIAYDEDLKEWSTSMKALK